MYANKCLLALLLPMAAFGRAEPIPQKPAGVASQAMQVPAPVTIGELSALARQKRLAEDNKPAPATTIPPGMTIVPSTSIVTGPAAAAPAEKAAPRKAKPVPPPEVIPGLLAIVKPPAGARYVELADTAGPRKYALGQVTPSGWTVDRIGTNYVELSKPAEKKKPVRQLTLSLSNP